VTGIISRDLHVALDDSQSSKVYCPYPPGEMRDQVLDLGYYGINCVALLLDRLKLFFVHAERRALVIERFVEVTQLSE
jgi:hypothetical protein